MKRLFTIIVLIILAIPNQAQTEKDFAEEEIREEKK